MSEIQSLLKLVLMLQFRCNQQEAAWLGLDHFLLPVPFSRFRLAGLPALIDLLQAARTRSRPFLAIGSAPPQPRK